MRWKSNLLLLLACGFLFGAVASVYIAIERNLNYLFVTAGCMSAFVMLCYLLIRG